mmetsp:Transcript_19862/g.29845  ORF Transcript_19862/g.29845 Transcript_19862/m.29845 type:complete len:448 (+) Transcript_19862:119-1462(+)
MSCSPNIKPRHCIRKNSSAHIEDAEGDCDNDETSLASFLFCLVGIGYLFPFSALTQPADYWSLLFPSFNIEFTITATYMYTNLLGLAVLVFFCPSNGNFSWRIVWGFIGQLLVLLLVPSSYFLHLDETSNYFVILGSTALVAIITAFLDSAVIALSTQYPIQVQESLQLGVGVSTLIGSIYRDVTKLAFPSSMLVKSSLLYFYAGAGTIGLCLWAFRRLSSLRISQKVLLSDTKLQQKSTANSDTNSNIATETSCLLGNSEEGTVLAAEKTQKNKKWVVLKKILFNELMVCLLFMSTLALWPPLVTEIPVFTFTKLEAASWWPLILLTIFSVMDCFGRLMVRWFRFFNYRNIWMGVLCRLLLFPLIVCSAIGILQSDVCSIIFVSLLGFTNGHTGTLCIIFVNDCLDTEEERAVAGSFTSFFLNCGLVLGATIGLALDGLIQHLRDD